jgi:hypothetical protein
MYITQQQRLFLLLFPIFIFGLPYYVKAQNPPPTNDRNTIPTFMFWFEADIVGKIGGQFKWQADIQIRTAADDSEIVGGSKFNPWKHPYQIVIRPWVQYELGKSGLQFSVSPLGYWAVWNYFNGEDTFEPELRSTYQVQYDSRAGKVHLTNRARYELRWFGIKEPTSSGFHIPAGSNSDFFDKARFKQRVRYMIRGIIPLKQNELKPGTWYVSVWDEVFIGFGQNVSNQNLLDQNRAYVGVGRQLGRGLRWEVGYLNELVPKLNQAPDYNNVELNHILATWLFFDDIHSFFRSK